jgi:putative phosphoesterase
VSRLGVISDTHDNLDKVRSAVALFNQLGIDQVIHCGDVVAQFVLAELSRLKMPVAGVFGNCDGDRAALLQRARQFGFTWQDAPFSLDVDGRRLVVTHQPLATLPDGDFYLHGHTHKLRHDPGRPAVVNPGEACGWLTGRASAAVVDVESGAVEFIDL